jgi:hypothetical protein
MSIVPDAFLVAHELLLCTSHGLCGCSHLNGNSLQTGHYVVLTLGQVPKQSLQYVVV